MMMPDGTRAFKNTEIWAGAIALCWQFHLDKVEETRNIINKMADHLGYVRIQHICEEKSREDEKKRFQKLIDDGVYGWAVDDDGLTEEEVKKIDPDFSPGWGYSGNRWTKWTADLLLKKNGWDDGEVYWFSIDKDNGLCYQLILRDGDWICFCPRLENVVNVFFNVGEDPSSLPYSSDWEEFEI